MLWWIVELEQAGGLHGVIKWFILILEVLIAVCIFVCLLLSWFCGHLYLHDYLSLQNLYDYLSL